HTLNSFPTRRSSDLQPDGSMAIASNIYSGPIMGTEGVGVTYAAPSILAATWNPDAAYLMGTSVGQEAQAFGYNGWYSPAMNIHRSEEHTSELQSREN